MKKVLVIIVSYNFEHWIERCLGSLRKSSYHVSVMVIDNCSKDRTTEIIEQHYPEVRLIKNKQNLGFGQANNIGVNISLQEDYDAVFLLNQDAWIDKETIGTLLKTHQKNPDYGILSPVHLNGKGDKPDHGFSTYTGIKELYQLSGRNEPVESGYINAAFWLIPAKVLREIGGFSPLFYHYGEDTDYINRIKYHGYKIGYVPSVFGYHDREFRTADHNTFLRSEKVFLLSEYANINYSFPQAFGYGVLAAIKKAGKALAHKKIKDSVAFMQITSDILLRTPEVVRTRKINKKKS